MISLKRLKIKSILMGSFFFIFLAITVICCFSIYSASQNSTLVAKARNEGSKFALLAKDTKTHVIQVQQWLTDISATRGLAGFDDGFIEAEKHSIAFKDNIKAFRIFYSQKIVSGISV